MLWVFFWVFCFLFVFVFWLGGGGGCLGFFHSGDKIYYKNLHCLYYLYLDYVIHCQSEICLLADSVIIVLQYKMSICFCVLCIKHYAVHSESKICL